MIELNALEWELADILVNTVLNHTGKYSYKELADELSKRLHKNVNPHYGLSIPLGNVSILCYELGLPLISAWVIYSGDANVKKISDGFYNFACDYRPEFKNMNPVDAWKIELRKIQNCSSWNILRDYLDGKQIVEALPNKEGNLTIEDNSTKELAEQKLQLHRFYQESKATEPVFPDEICTDASNLTEGAIKQVTINIRERNSNARRIDIGCYGIRCTVCGVDLGEVYGQEFSGKIHVHHLNPIGDTQEEHQVNPLEDLRPVCPNCHMIIHCRQNPPYTIEEVKQMIINNKRD